jgi:hypothetical protein
MLRAKWRILALLLPFVGGCAAYAENDERGWDQPTPVYQGDSNGYDQGQLFYPEQGVVCDRAQLICYGEGGFNTRATKRFFGEEAARRGEEQWDRYGQNYGQDYGQGYGQGYGNNGVVFSPRRGVICDRRIQICSTSSGIDVSRTGKVFGDTAKRNARNWLSAEHFSPLRKVVCDNSSRVCFERRRPDLKLTEFFYGRGAARDLAWQTGRRF